MNPINLNNTTNLEVSPPVIDIYDEEYLDLPDLLLRYDSDSDDDSDDESNYEDLLELVGRCDFDSNDNDSDDESNSEEEFKHDTQTETPPSLLQSKKTTADNGYTCKTAPNILVNVQNIKAVVEKKTYTIQGVQRF